jgi:hypothetical protein
MSERTEADQLAEKLLDEPNADPDDDLRMLSRQLLRRREVIERLENHLASIQDSTLDLIHANRDSILTKHEEAISLIKMCLENGLKDPSGLKYALEAWCKKALEVVRVLNLFHPMHGESWPGWPIEKAGAPSPQ